MDSRRNPLALLKTVVDTVFRRDLALRREGRAVRLVLQSPDGAPAAPSPAELERQRLEQELHDARADLARLLDEDAGHRAAMRHLAAVEHALGRIGWQAFERLPLEVLQRALQQLEDAVTNWSARGLAGLRSRMAVAVARRSRPEPAAPSTAGRAAGRAAAPAAERPPAVAARAIDKARRQAGAAAAGTSHDDADRALLAAYSGLVDGPPLQVVDDAERR